MTIRELFVGAVQQQMLKMGIVSQMKDVEWGSLSVLEDTNLTQLTRSSLKRHLEARGEDITGNKNQLIDRLLLSMQDEQEKIIAIEQEVEKKHRQVAELEEKGAVYVIGSNHKGQLGLGDLIHRSIYTVIPETRGINISTVVAGNEINFAISEDHSVYTWGGAGVGPMGLKDTSRARLKFEMPQTIKDLEGEEIISVVSGSNHTCALSKGGDMFVFGGGKCGCLGLGNLSNSPRPVLMNSLDKNIEFKDVKVGEVHTCALTTNGELYAWGHSANGRLGIGKRQRESVPEEEKKIFHFPSLVLLEDKVRIISCGSEHSTIVTNTSIFSWGVGDGGRLGHGDFTDRWEPTEIKALKRCAVVDVSCGTWHSSCIVIVPPMRGAGMVYTWGSGYHGQLGQGKAKVSPSPRLVRSLLETQLYAKKIFSGSYHNAVIVGNGELYTWGYNLNSCLGHNVASETDSFTAQPGHVGGFGAIVGSIGRGMPRSVACGKGYTIVATWPYSGPSQEEAKIMLQNHKNEVEEMKRLKQNENQKKFQEEKEIEERIRKKELINFLTKKRLCTLDPKCPGFQVHASKPSICRECGHSSVYHTIVVDD